MDFNLHRPSGHSQAMDFNVYAGADDSSFTCTPPNGYFATQALRVGLLGKTTMHSLPRPFPEHREIGREIMKERIREEIIAGEMAERKILEEEVRKELEMERIMKMRRSQMERTRFSLLADTSDTVNRGNQMMQPFFPSYPQARSGPSRNFARDAAEFTFRERSPTHLRQKKPMMVVDESFLHHNSEKFLPSEQARSGPSRNFARDAAEFTFCERSPAHPRQKKPMILVEESFLHHNSKKFLPSKQNTTSNFKLSGAKRKNREASPLWVKKQWGCALCQVHTTCENTLKAHLEGKKHKAKEASIASMSISRKEPLLSSEKASHPQPKKNGALPLKGASASGPKNKKLPPVKGASILQTNDTSASGPKNKKQPSLKGTSGGGPGKRFWCPVCKVRCNSEKMLESHRTGKKHKIFMDSMKDSNSFANKNSGDTGAQGFVKEVAEAGAEGLTDGEQLGTGDGN